MSLNYSIDDPSFLGGFTFTMPKPPPKRIGTPLKVVNQHPNTVPLSSLASATCFQMGSDLNQIRMVTGGVGTSRIHYVNLNLGVTGELGPEVLVIPVKCELRVVG